MACVIDSSEGPIFENTIIRVWEESGSRKNLSKKYRNNIPLSKAVNREDKRSRRYRDRDFAKFERSRRFQDRYRC